jgi:peroxiredoxin Q/BCP
MSNMEKLKVGSKLPKFTGTDQLGNEINSEHLNGKRVVVYFYPKDNTPGCTAQACSIRDSFSDLNEKGIVVIGISTDSISSHKKFGDKFNLPFSLLPDEDKMISQAFGVWGEKKFMGKTYDGIHRTSFLFDEDSTLKCVIDKPNTKDHGNEILKNYGF